VSVATTKAAGIHRREPQEEMRNTNERLMDQEALRWAAIRAGLEQPPVASKWTPTAVMRPKPDSLVEFAQRRGGHVRLGHYLNGEFIEQSSADSWPLQEVSRWRCVNFESA
jgi:hypothetical protein